MSNRKLLLGCMVLAAAQTACTQLPQRIELGGDPATPTSDAEHAQWGVNADNQVATSGIAQTGSQVRIYEGTGVVVQPPRPGRALVGSAGEFNFEAAPIAEVIHVMMGDILQADYVLHQPIAGTLTLATKKPVSKDRAMSLLETALMANGLHIAQDTGGFYHIGKPEALRGIVPVPRQVGNGPLAPGYGAILIPLEYISASEMAEILRPVMQEDSLIRVDSVRNILVLAGTRPQAEGWMELVRTFDVDLLKGMSVGIFPLKYATVADIQAGFELLSAATGGEGANISQQRGATGGGNAPPDRQQQANARLQAQAAAFAAAMNAGNSTSTGPQAIPFLGSMRLLPLERLNSIMAVTPYAEHLQQIREWIERLDQPNDSTEAQLFVYGVQNGSATHLAQVLGGIFGGNSSTGATANSGVAPGLGVAQSSTGRTGGTQSGMNLSGQGTSQSHTTENTAPVAMDLNGVRVIADPLNNAILVWGSRMDYEKIETTLRKLDRPPVQVVLEASIVEVSLTNDLQYGLRWAFSGALGGSQYQGSGGSSGLVGLTPATALGAAAGLTTGGAGAFSYAVTRGDSVNALLSMLASRSLVKMLSSPSLLVLDNHTASITVGDQVPITTGVIDYTNSGGTNSRSIQYKDTGVILKVTPSVNAGDRITLAIDQSVTNVGEAADTDGNRSFMQRQLSSKVSMRSGEPIVLGGLIRENSTASKDGIPGLVDVPVLGNAFGATKNNVNRTELLVVLTPTVLRTDDELRDAGRELRERMQTLLRTRVQEIRKGGPVLPGEEVLLQEALQPALKPDTAAPAQPLSPN